MVRIPENELTEPLNPLTKKFMVLFGMGLIFVGVFFLVFAGVMVIMLLDFQTKPAKPVALLCTAMGVSLACCYLTLRAALRLIGDKTNGKQISYAVGELCLAGSFLAGGLIYPASSGQLNVTLTGTVATTVGLLVLAWVFFKTA